MLRNMITDSDVKKLKTIFATKKDFQEVKQDLNKTKKVVFDIAKEVVNIKHNISQLATKEEILNFKSEVLDRMDKVYGLDKIEAVSII